MGASDKYSTSGSQMGYNRGDNDAGMSATDIERRKIMQ